MDYVLCGTDRRMNCLAELLHRAGHRVRFWQAQQTTRFETLDTLLELAAPVRLVCAPRTEEATLKKAVETLPAGSRIYANAACSCKARGITSTDLSQDDDYLTALARPTAEGALCELICRTPDDISHTKICVFGSGRVAREVLRLCAQIGMQTTVAARNEAALSRFKKEGHKTLKLPLSEKKLCRLEKMDALVNTVPSHHIIDARILQHVRRETPILELASGSENIDTEAAKKAGADIVLLPALPGKCAPMSAARALFDALDKTTKKDRSP